MAYLQKINVALDNFAKGLVSYSVSVSECKTTKHLSRFLPNPLTELF